MALFLTTIGILEIYKLQIGTITYVHQIEKLLLHEFYLRLKLPRFEDVIQVVQ